MDAIELAVHTPLPPSRSNLHLPLDSSSTLHLPQASTSTLHLPAAEILQKDSSSIETLNDENPIYEFEDYIHENESSLAPVDRGFSAWSLLASAFLVEVLVWGFPNSFGVLLAAYLDDPVYNSQPDAASRLPLVGTLCTGIMYCSAIFVYPTMHYFPAVRRYYTWIGTAMCCLSLIGASYTTQVTALVALQGVIFAIGGSLIYAPIVSYMSEWFVQRRGLANGIVFAGSNAGGVFFPLIIPHFIAKYGIMKTTRIYAVALAVCLAPALPFMKARLPESRVHGPARRSSRSWLRDRQFWFFMSINALQGFAHFIPLIWLPTFAAASGLSTAQSSLALTLVNASSVFAGFIMGFLSDKFNIWALALGSLVCTSLVTFVLWGVLSYSLGGILAYGIAYGGTAGGWSSMWNGFVRPIAKDDPTLSTTIFSFLLLGRGIGNIVSTPISTALQRAHVSAAQSAHKLGFMVADGQYRDMIVYAGSMFAGAAVLAFFGWQADRYHR